MIIRGMSYAKCSVPSCGGEDSMINVKYQLSLRNI